MISTQTINTPRIILSTKSIKLLIDTRHYGQGLKLARKQLGITRKDVAQHIGVGRMQMLRFENGKEIIPKHVLLRLFLPCLNECKVK